MVVGSNKRGAEFRRAFADDTARKNSGHSLDRGRQPLSQERADTFTKSSLSHVISWRGQSDISALAGKPVRLRFHLRNVKLYAFQFQ